MSFKKILVPFDGSEHARAALEVAKEFLTDPQAEIHIISVVPIAAMPPALNMRSDPFAGSAASFIDYDEYSNLINDALENAKNELEETLAALINMPGRVVVEAVPNESIARGITAYSTEHQCDVIVMGRRGLGAIRGMLGSVSFAVLREADIPVMTVK